MKFCNLHDDIGSDIFTHKEDDPNRLDGFHVPRMLQGGMYESAIVCCFCGTETWQDMQEQILYVHKKIEESPYVSFSDDKKLQVFIVVEGMCGIKEQVKEKITWLYEHHVRLASLCWNDKNALACGAKSGNHPLTQLGKECIQAMNDLHMAVDVSHCCEWNFYDIARISNAPIIATHSNIKALYDHYRNLSDLQIQVIRDKGGIIGALPVRWFVTKDETKQTIDEFIKIIDYLKHKIGIEAIALGFDFMDYMDDATCMVKGLESVTEIQNLVTALKAYGYEDEEIERICYKNAHDFMKSYLNK